MARTVPFPAFNFEISLDDANTDVAGAFSDVSGLGTELAIAEYRAGTDPENHVRKVPGLNKCADVTLKRGLMTAEPLLTWFAQAREQGPDAKRSVVIRLLNEKRETVQTWTLTGVIPLKWTGPTLAAKGGGEVAMEEVVLSCEGLYFGELGT